MVEDGRGDRSKRGGDGAKVREDTGGGLLGHVVKELEREVLGKGGKGAEGRKGKAEFGEKVENEGWSTGGSRERFSLISNR
jgi:hypothetical protein